MQKLNFNTQDQRRLPMRPAPDSLKSSQIRQGVFEVGTGERPALAAYAFRYLPVLFKDITTQDCVVINKGKIVSMITNQNSGLAASGIPNPSASGTIPVYDDATASTTSIQTVNIDNHYFGYGETVAGLLVPCNGYTAATYTYTALDVEAKTFKSASAYAAAGNTFALPANLPVGVLMADCYQDIRGKYLNYQMWDVTGILCDFYVEVPYVDKTTTLGTSLSLAVDPVGNAIYKALFAEHAFLTIDTGLSAQAGALIGSDAYGEYVVQVNGNGNRTASTVGKLILTDSRFPKGGLEMVDTYPGSKTAGTETGGLPDHLYKFVYSALNAASLACTPDKCLEAVQDGTFGLARLQLEI